MTGYDIVDEEVIDAPPEIVWDELLAELHGARRWWVPHNTFEPGAVPPEVLGGEVQVTVHTRGAHRRGLKLRCTARTRAVEPGRRLVADYVQGVFRGTGTFILEPVDGGRRTRLAMQFRALPHGWLRVLAKVVDIGAEHSTATRHAFTALATHLAAAPATPTTPDAPDAPDAPAPARAGATGGDPTRVAS
jgi:uncharacterized protein YndB with AHSA1/START domain